LEAAAVAAEATAAATSAFEPQRAATSVPTADGEATRRAKETRRKRAVRQRQVSEKIKEAEEREVHLLATIEKLESELSSVRSALQFAQEDRDAQARLARYFEKEAQTPILVPSDVCMICRGVGRDGR